MSKRNLTLLTDLYELTMMQGYYEKGQNEKVILMYFSSEPLQQRIFCMCRS